MDVESGKAVCAFAPSETADHSMALAFARMAKRSPRQVQPNEKCELQVSVDTNRFVGPKTATVYLDVQTAQGQQKHEVTIAITPQDAPLGAAPMLAPRR